MTIQEHFCSGSAATYSLYVRVRDLLQQLVHLGSGFVLWIGRFPRATSLPSAVSHSPAA